MSYTPNPVPQDVEQIPAFLSMELMKLADSPVKGDKGDTGSTGDDGTSQQVRFIYSSATSAPALPANNSTSGWNTASDSTTIWMSQQTNTLDSSLVVLSYGAWQPAVKIKGEKGDTGSTGGTGATGQRGSGEFYTTGSSWSDATANAAVYAVYPTGGNINGDTVTISNGTNYAMTKFWNGSAWVAPGTVLDGNLLVSGTVSAAKINANGLTIRDPSGNIILDAGSSSNNLDFSKVSGSTKPENNATVGANWATNLTSRPYNLSVLTGTEGINNMNVLANSSFNVLSDDGFRDPTWWGFGTSWPTGFAPQDGTVSGQPNRFIRITGPLSDFGYVGFFASLAPAKVFRLRTYMYMSPGFTGYIAPSIHVPGIMFAVAGSPTTIPSGTYTGYPAHTAATWGTGAWYVRDVYFTTSSDNNLAKIQSYFYGNVSSGYCEVYQEVTPLFGDGTKIDNSNISTYIANLAVGNAQIANLDVGKLTTGTLSASTNLTVGTAARSGTTMTGAGAVFEGTGGYFSLGNSTKNITFDGTAFYLNGPVVSTSNIANNAVTSIGRYWVYPSVNYTNAWTNLYTGTPTGSFATMASDGVFSVRFRIDIGDVATNTTQNWIRNEVKIKRNSTYVAIENFGYILIPNYSVLRGVIGSVHCESSFTVSAGDVITFEFNGIAEDTNKVMLSVISIQMTLYKK